MEYGDFRIWQLPSSGVISGEMGSSPEELGAEEAGSLLFPCPPVPLSRSGKAAGISGQKPVPGIDSIFGWTCVG